MIETDQSPERHNPAEFIIVLLGSTFLMGSSFVAGKILLQNGFPALLLVGWRFLVAALATLPLAFLGGAGWRGLRPPHAGLRDGVLVILIGLLQTAAVMGLLFVAMRSISAATAAILLFTNPIWVALLGRIFLGDPLHGASIVGLLLGLVGVGFAIGVGPEIFSSGNTVTGELIGLLSSLCWATATLINKRAALPLGPWALSFWQMLIGSLGLIGIAYGLGQRWPATTSITEWSWFFWLAIPASTGSFGLWFVALEKGGATRASSFLFLTPLFTVLLAFFVLHTPLTWQQGLGGALIGLSLWLINRRMSSNKAREVTAVAIAEGRP
jgi:drug/metabolite transporter (DMT)-like permease